MSRRIVEVLELAAALVERGWTQDCTAVGPARVALHPEVQTPIECDPADADAAAWCAVGAIERAAFELTPRAGRDVVEADEAVFDASSAAVEALAEAIVGARMGDADPGVVVMRWNDRRGRTAAEVLSMLRHAARTAREGV